MSDIKPTEIIPRIFRNFAPTTVVVSRVQRFYEYPDKIYPVSCTNTEVQDTYFNDDVDEDGNPLVNFYESIAGSRVYVSKVLKGNAGVVVDLNHIRPKGIPGSNGMISAGVANFMAMYSMINQEVRRGSAFKNGAVLLQLDFDHPDLEDFLNTSSSVIPWAKRGVTVRPGWLEHPNYPLIEQAINAGRIFLYKQQYNNAGEPLKINVCQGIVFKSRSTCTLAHVNLGAISQLSQIVPSFEAGAEDLNTIWKDFYTAWEGEPGQPKRGAAHFINPKEDKQVGLGVLGLANMLCNFNVKYNEFVPALEFLMNRFEKQQYEDISHLEPLAVKLAHELIIGFHRAKTIFQGYGYERAFTVEPTATCAYKQKDARGYTCSPEISPPIANPETKITRRVADDGFVDYQYPMDIEIAGEVDWHMYTRLCEVWQRMMDSTGLAHAISYNWWLSRPVDRVNLLAWDASPLKTVYYRWKEKAEANDKTSIGIEVDEESENFWSMDEEEEEVTICQLNDKNDCKTCGG